MIIDSQTFDHNICIFNTFKKYLYWLFSILLAIVVLVLINNFFPVPILFWPILFKIGFITKKQNFHIKVRIFLQVHEMFRELSDKNFEIQHLIQSWKNKTPYVQQKGCFWNSNFIISKSIDLLVVVFSILFEFQKYWSIGESILFLEVLSICIEIL